jgi:CDP-glycerol glycerophosphotransferase (TagB/SpsB family)
LLLSRRKLLLVGSHTGHLSGNALGLAVAAQASSDFNVAFIGEHPPVGLAIPTFDLKDLTTRLLLKRADAIAYTGHSTKFEAASPHALRLLLWHGMPIKAIGASDPLCNFRRGSCDLAIATSAFTAGIVAEAFQITLEKILVSGEPKTDFLPADRPPWNWTSSLRSKYRKIVAYLPTWRETLVEQRGRPQRKGNEAAVEQIVSRLTTDAALGDLLKRHQAAFVVRLHPIHGRAQSLPPPFFCMNDAQGDATHLLQECDVVISDYSSVVIDALLFPRPLALWCEDLDSYQISRSLPYFDFHATFGWAFKASLPDLRDWLAERLESRPVDRSESEGFTRCRSLFHEYGRGDAGQRVLAALRTRLAQR